MDAFRASYMRICNEHKTPPMHAVLNADDSDDCLTLKSTNISVAQVSLLAKALSADTYFVALDLSDCLLGDDVSIESRILDWL